MGLPPLMENMYLNQSWRPSFGAAAHVGGTNNILSAPHHILTYMYTGAQAIHSTAVVPSPQPSRHLLVLVDEPS